MTYLLSRYAPRLLPITDTGMPAQASAAQAQLMEPYPQGRLNIANLVRELLAAGRQAQFNLHRLAQYPLRLPSRPW